MGAGEVYAATTATSILLGIWGAGEQGKAAGEALEAQAKALGLSTEALQAMYTDAMKFGEPFREAGREYLPELRAEAEDMGLSEQARYEMDLGERAIARGTAAAGKRESGERARSISDLYGNILTDEYNRKYGQVLDLTNVGVGASSAAMKEALATGSSIADTYMAGGQTAADYISARGQIKATGAAAASQLISAGGTGYMLAKEV